MSEIDDTLGARFLRATGISSRSFSSACSRCVSLRVRESMLGSSLENAAAASISTSSAPRSLSSSSSALA